MASVRRDQELPLCWTEPVPASSKSDSVLDKAEPISDAGGTSVIALSRKDKKHYMAAARREKCE